MFAQGTLPPDSTYRSFFLLLGYVLASKRDRKFAGCAADLSFAAICDSTRNVYIYRNDVAVDSELKNRKTGKIVKTVARQHVITLDKPGAILGFAVALHNVFILKSDYLYVIPL